MMRGIGPGYRMMEYGGNWPLKIACMLFILAVIALAVFLLIRLFYKPHKHDENNIFLKNPAQAILDERYVKGEISDEEYLTKKNNLK